MLSEFRADLHCHTTCSDGSLSPLEIVQLAQKSGLSGLSITDHDNIDAYATAIPACLQANINLLTGVEFSSTLQDTSVHILAYGFHPENPFIRDFCARHLHRRSARNQGILNLLAKHGMPLTESDLTAATPSLPKAFGRPHIATAMLKKGYVASFQEAFQKFLAEDRPCYTPGIPFSVEESLETIHRANAVAIIAHPHLINNNEVLNVLLNMNFDGIECYYGKFQHDKHERWLKIAKKKNWLVTGGSDFHGINKPLIDLGCSWVDEARFNAIKAKAKG